jgi:hypothetical protein
MGGVTSIGSRMVSSKFPSRRSSNEFYRYYAGYPIEFAEWALGKLELSKGALVIDPWNGSGTTGAACARVGLSCHGYDINPVMVHLGRARVSSSADFEEAADIISTVGELIGSDCWTTVKEVGIALRELPVGSEAAHSIAVTALFPYARRLLGAEKTKNPSWFRRGATLRDIPLETSALFENWRTLLAQVSLWRSTSDDANGVSIAIERGDSRKSLGRKDAFQGLLTSPPYLTRLDYVHATLPEFLLLREFDSVPNMERLRRSMLGSPLTSDRPDATVERLPANLRALLRRIHVPDAGAYIHRS